MGGLETQDGDGGRPTETPVTRASRVHEQDPINFSDERLVRVAVHDGREVGVPLHQILDPWRAPLMPVDDGKLMAYPFELDFLGRDLPNVPTIDIPVDSVDRCYDLELGEDPRVAHIACVYDLLHTFEGGINLVPKKPVRVGDETDAGGVAHSPFQRGPRS